MEGKSAYPKSYIYIYIVEERSVVPVVIPLTYGMPRSEKAMFSNTSLPGNQK